MQIGEDPTRALPVPAGWRRRLGAYSWVRRTEGLSGARVFGLCAEGRDPLFVKCEPDGPFAELGREADRLRWLSGRGVPCPTVLDECVEDGRRWLLMTAVAGCNLAAPSGLVPDRIVAAAADGLRMLHGLDAGSCPFDQRLDNRIAEATARVEAGLVDEEDFDEDRGIREAADLFRELCRTRPDSEDLVVVHGDAGLPNLLADAGAFSGFVDCGRLGVGDRHQDLAIVTRDIAAELGEEWVPRFLARYGIAADPGRLSFYRMLDEFF